jgi:hypothetical protein
LICLFFNSFCFSYDGIFKRKTRDGLNDDPNAIDGCATFYRRERFALMEQYGKQKK